MVLEATVLCLDDSEYMRNGDFAPSRLEAQRDAANLVLGTKLRDNPESTVGLLSMAQKINVLSTLTQDKGKVMACLHGITPGSKCDFVSGIQVAQLILKHRQSKNHRQRIVVFVGSPVEASEKQLVTLAKKLKKSNVSVDVISFGEEEQNQSKLEAFISNVNKEDNSHLVVVPSGSGRLSDSVMNSPMFTSEGGSGAQTGTGGMGDMDLDNDPELAMALRISLEEERQRQRQAGDGEGEGEQTAAGEVGTAQQQQQQQQQQESQAQSQGQEGQAESQTQGQEQPAGTAQAQQASGGAPNFEAMTEEEMLQYAMQMSLQDQGSQGEAETATEGSTPGAAEEGAAQAAKKSKTETESPKDQAAEGAMDIFQDPAYLSSVLGGLPGVDPSDSQVQEMLASMSKSTSGEQENDEEKKDEEKEGDKKDDSSSKEGESK